MKKMNGAYVESVIKKAIGGFLMIGRAVAVWDGKLWDTVEVEKRKPKDSSEKPRKKGGRPCWKPGPNHP